MKIGEFAEMNNVTTKMLRHYDEIGLLKPAVIDEATGYRSYEEQQSRYLSWIVILKNLDFSLARIKEMLSGPIDGKKLIYELLCKRIEISSLLNEQIQKKIEIDALIRILEKEGFQMDKQIDLLNIDQNSVHEIKKNIPNMEMFLEEAQTILASCTEDDYIAVMRFDLWHFKEINDLFGFEVGDSVIVASYNIIRSNMGKYLNHAALGRAHGDEFIVFTVAGIDDVEKFSQAIVNDMESFDTESIGCKRQIACCIGWLAGRKKSVQDIRKMFEDSLEIIFEAKKGGKNSIKIQAYGV